MEDEIAECGNGCDRPEEFDEGGKRWEVNLAIKVSAETGKKTFRERFEE